MTSKDTRLAGPCGCPDRPEGHGSRLAVWIEADENIRAVKRHVSITRRRCPACGSTWSDDMPGRAGLRVDDLLFDQVLSLSTEMSYADVSAATGLSKHLVSRIVEANLSEEILHQRLVPPFIVRRVGTPYRIVDAAGEPVWGAMALTSGSRRASSFARVLGGPFLCDLPSLAWIRRLMPGAQSFLHPAAADFRTQEILQALIDGVEGNAARSDVLRRAFLSVSTRIRTALQDPVTCESMEAVDRIVLGLEGELRRLCVPVVHALRALPPGRPELMEAAHPAVWIRCGEFSSRSLPGHQDDAMVTRLRFDGSDIPGEEDRLHRVTCRTRS